MEKGVRIKTDPTKVGWEDSEFPILCENCLGDNPYVRMTREPFGGACKVCERPFTVFRWKPGAKARFKCTVLCQMCAKVKHVCQTCIFDLQYGLPVEVRDKVLQQAAAQLPGGSTALVGGAGLGGSVQPTSDVNRQYALNQAAGAMGDGAMVPYASASSITPAAHEALLRMGRSKPYYDRNLPKLCSFFARGECNRGGECPFRHEMPKDKDDPLSKQNYKDRYYGSEDPVAEKMMGRMAERRAAGRDAAPQELPEHEDPTALTVWVGGLAEGVSQEEVRGAFYVHGDVKSVFLTGGSGSSSSSRSGSDPSSSGADAKPKARCAFVEFGSHEQAKAAVLATRGSVVLGGAPASVSWARKKSDGSGVDNRLLGAAADPNAGAAPPQAAYPAHGSGSNSVSYGAPGYPAVPVPAGTPNVAPWAAAAAGLAAAPPAGPHGGAPAGPAAGKQRPSDAGPAGGPAGAPPPPGYGYPPPPPYGYPGMAPYGYPQYYAPPPPGYFPPVVGLPAPGGGGGHGGPMRGGHHHGGGPGRGGPAGNPYAQYYPSMNAAQAGASTGPPASAASSATGR